MHHPVLTRWSRPLASLAFVLVIVLSACSFNLGGTTSTPEQGGGSGTPAPTQQSQTSTCQGLSGFGSAQTATAGTGFGDVSFPANSISTTIATSGGGSGRFIIKQFDVCTSGSTVSSIHSFFASGLPGAGWSQAARYPYDGAWPASCGDPYCWKKDNKSRYVSLEKVTARGNGLVSYHIRLALPPAGPTCMSSLGIYDGKTWATYPNNVPDIYAPPFTLDGLGEGHDDTTSYGQYMNGECSAGSYTSVNSYFTSELAAHGWSHSTPSSTLASACHTTGTQWWKGSEIFSWFNDTSDNATAAANTAYWGFNWCHSK